MKTYIPLKYRIVIQKNNLKRIKYFKFEYNNIMLKSIIKNKKYNKILNIENHNNKVLLYYKYNRKNYLNKIKNYCIISSAKRSIYRFVKLSRHCFKNFINSKYSIPGFRKSSW